VRIIGALTPLYYIRRARELGIRETWLQGKELILGRSASAVRSVYDRHFRTQATESEILKITGFSSPSELLNHLRSRSRPAFFFDSAKAASISTYMTLFPDATAAILKAAENVMEHRFDLLGSGPASLADAISSTLKIRRSNGRLEEGRVSAYLPWNVDFKSGFGWDEGTYYKNIRYGDIAGVDVKVPWELSRFHHLIVLGQAFQFTHNERYALEFRRQVEDWIGHNPCRFGVNWSCTMEVGIRAVNWIWAFHLFLRSERIDSGFALKLLTALYNHATFIRGNLEFRQASINGAIRRLNSNHYSADIVGLLYISLLFPELKLDEEENFAARELEIELFEQTADDGVDYEHSTFYHRLVLEIFLSGFALLQFNGTPIKPDVAERLARMAKFVADYTRPDGSVPQIGDNDDGRLHPLSIREKSNHRYLPTLAAHLLDRPDLAAVTNDPEVWWWIHEPRDLPFVARCSSAYPTTGFYILRSETTHLFACAATVGMHGLGSHSHNDLLSFEYWANGQAWIVDPGTYVYTPDPEARNLFRSTEAHNGVRIDTEEINPIRNGQLFQLGDQARVKVIQWTTADCQDLLEIAHTGYMQGQNPVMHTRRFVLSTSSGDLHITDSFEGKGVHRLEWFLHIHPSVMVTTDRNRVILGNGKSKVQVTSPDADRNWEIRSFWYSPSYGCRERAPMIVLSKTSKVPLAVSILITAKNA